MLAKEGRAPVLVLAVGGMLGAYAIHPSVALVFWAFGAAAWMLFRSRKPQRNDLPLVVVSPVGGTVCALGETYDPWCKRDALRVSVRLPFPGIGELFSPADGRIEGFWTDLATQREASSLDAWLESPTRYTLGITTDGGDEVVYTVASTRRHSRLKFDQAPGERAKRGARSGFAYFAATVDVLVPPGSRLDVSDGEVVAPGQTIVTLVHG